MALTKKLSSRFRPGGIGRNISWLLLHSGIEAATMTVASLLAARWFGPASLGQLAILLAGVQLVTYLGDGFFPTIIKYVSEAKARDNSGAALLGWRFAGTSVGVLILAAVVMGFVSFAFFQSQLTITLVLLAVALAVARGWRAVLDGCYRGMQEFRIPAVIGSLCTTIMAGCIIGFAAAGYRVTMYLGVMLAGMAINCLCLAWAYHRRFLRAEKPTTTTPPPTKDFLRYSLPLALRGVASFLFLNINILILGGISSLEDVGQFRLTNQFLTIPALILSSVLSAVAPRVAAAQMGSDSDLGLFLSRVYGLMLILTIPLALLFWFNEPFIRLFFPAYGPAGQMLAFFAPAMAVMGLGYASSILPVQGGKPGLALGISVTSGLVNVIVAYIGLRVYGVMGLAMATAVVHFCTYLASVAITHRAFGIPFRVRFS